MARGWESKSIEEQQLDLGRPDLRRGPVDDPVRVRQRQSIELPLARIRADLARARNDAHRLMLEQAAGELERRLAEIDSSRSAG